MRREGFGSAVQRVNDHLPVGLPCQHVDPRGQVQVELSAKVLPVYEQSLGGGNQEERPSRNLR